MSGLVAMMSVFGADSSIMIGPSPAMPLDVNIKKKNVEARVTTQQNSLRIFLPFPSSSLSPTNLLGGGFPKG